MIQDVLHKLTCQGLLAEVGEEVDPAYLPARDLDAITVKRVLDALKGTYGHVEFPAEERADERVDRILSGLDQEMETSPHNLTLRQLAARPRRITSRRRRGEIVRRRQRGARRPEG
jgi:DNA-binding IscR family transcriptional regulator